MSHLNETMSVAIEGCPSLLILSSEMQRSLLFACRLLCHLQRAAQLLPSVSLGSLSASKVMGAEMMGAETRATGLRWETLFTCEMDPTS